LTFWRGGGVINSKRLERLHRQTMCDDQDQEQVGLRIRLAQLEIEHEDFDHAIQALTMQGADVLRIQRFKKKKLALKDEISRLRDRILPDIIA
jgi:hypothetical protein